MNQDQSSLTSWQIALLVILGIIAAILIAFLFAQVDTVQRRSSVPSNGPPINDLEATAAAGELSTIYLQSEVSPTPSPSITPTVTEPSSAELVPEETAVKVETNCGQISGNSALYVVRSGDTLASVAGKFGLSEDAIRLANCLTHDHLIEGQQLFLPQNGEIVVPTLSPCDEPPSWKRYKIAPGDTLPNLARTYGTSVYHIMKANCLKSAELGIESEIFLPNLD